MGDYKPYKQACGFRPDLLMYERAKSEWQALNPQATHQQFQVAMRILADRCGV